MARHVATAGILALCCVPLGLGAAEAVPVLKETIQAQPMASALANYFSQTGRDDVDWTPGFVDGARSRRVVAGTPVDEALCRLLEGTGLTTVDAGGGRAKRIVRGEVAPECAQPQAVELDEIRIAAQRSLIGDPSVDPAEDRDSFTIIRDSKDLADRGVPDIDRLARDIPGLDFGQLSSVGGNIYTIFAINGVIDRHGNTSGIWWDGVPLPAATSNSFARAIPYNFDIDFKMRFGPQPVLLGANAQSGAIEYLPALPSLNAYTGQLRSEWAVTRGGDPTREVGAAWGGPIKDGKLGFRVSGWYRTEGGYVDRVDPFAPGHPVVESDSNELTMESARLALLYRPNRAVTLLPSFVYQATIGHDSPSFMLWEDPARGPLSDPAAGKFLNGSIIRQPISDSFRLASLRSFFHFGSLRLEGMTGYVHRFGAMTSDDATSKRWHCLDTSTPQCEYPSSPAGLVTTRVNLAQRSFTQQFQLTPADDDRTTSWLLGAFFADLHSRETDRVFADPLPFTIQAYYGYLASLGQDVPDNFFWRVPTTIQQRQLAGFAQVRRRFLDQRLTLSAGARVESQRVRANAIAPTDGSIPDHAIGVMRLNDPLPDQTSTVFAPQMGMTYEPTGAVDGREQEFSVYYASGYAPGNVDAARPTCREPPTVYPSDKLHSIQIAMRQAWSNRRTQLDLELFQFDWDNGPQAWRTCLFMHLPGKARSRGFRISARAEPFNGAFKATLDAAYVDARYRETIRNDYLGRVTDTGGVQDPDNAVLVRKGDALGTPPQVIAPWSIKASLEKDFNLPAATVLTLRLTDTFRSRNRGPFYMEDPEAAYPGNLQPDPVNNLLDARAIFTRKDVKVIFYVSNVLDSRPVLSRRNKGNDTSTLFYATTFRPRTVGLSVNWNIGIKTSGQ